MLLDHGSDLKKMLSVHQEMGREVSEAEKGRRDGIVCDEVDHVRPVLRPPQLLFPNNY